MTAHTYFVALPFKRSVEGHLVPGLAKECACATTAAVAAEDFGEGYVGAIAFSRVLDSTSGTCCNTRLLRSVGDVPNLDYLLRAA